MRVVTVLALLAIAAPAAVDAGAIGPPACFGAASRDPLRPCQNAKLRYTVTPSPAEALDAPNAPCDPVADGGQLYRCTFGSPPENARGTMALIGDSHAIHWRAALQTVAARRHWHGISINLSGCPFTKATPVLLDSEACVQWNRDVLSYVTDHPEITTVVLGQHRARVVVPVGVKPIDAQVRGYQDAWAALPASVERIVVIRDTPYQRTYTPRCLQQARRRHQQPGLACALPRRSVLRTDPAALAARRATTDPRVALVDMTHYFCGSQLCYPVIGGALVHKDMTHISLAYATTLGPYLLRAMDPLLGR